MSQDAHFARRLRRMPLVRDPEIGRDAAMRVGADGDPGKLIAGAAAASPYLNDLIHREADWLAGALPAPEAALGAELAAAGASAPDDLASALRRAKRRVALLAALADLGGVWPLDTVMRILSEFAGQAVQWALRAELDRLAARGRLPAPAGDDSAGFAGMVALAMGKMGAFELNYSSDIDLICLFDDTLYTPGEVADVRQALVRVTRAMTQLLSERTAEGYVFRTDLRLRPDPAVTPVCLSMAAAEQYYESFGRTWERAAMIKARPAAGDLAAGTRFLSDIAPFIWRRHLDFAAIEDAHDIRLRIRDSKHLHGPVLVPGHDIKLGQGGIREIEFFTQTRQLIAGGRDPDLRMRGTEAALAALAGKGWIPEEVAERLTAHYRTFREVEHRIQMIHDAQTHTLPATEEGLERVAALTGQGVDEMTADLAQRLTEVSEMTEGFFTPGGRKTAGAPPPDHDFDTAILDRWSHYPALRSARAARIFDRLRPDLLRRLSRSARPDEALLALDGFLAGLPAGVQLFALFEANRDLIDLLVDIVGVSPALAGYLSRNSSVFDAVIGGDFFAPWPGPALARQLAEKMAGETDYERRLDMARRWKKEWSFRIGVHFLRGIIDAQTAGAQYGDLADAVLASVWPEVIAEFSRRHGAPPGRGAAIVGMGSLGARRMNVGSDLDLIVIYDAEGVETSDGPRPLVARTYYARLTQALITAMSAPMAQGRLYDIDMRLRPSGNQGPVATSWSAFRTYQIEEAWKWEHLALTRARVVTGPPGLSEDIERLRAGILAGRLGGPQDRAEICRCVGDMRNRLAAAKTPSGLFDVRAGAGRMQDVELVAQAGILMSGGAGGEGADQVSAGLAGAARAGWLDPGAADALAGAYRLFWAVHAATRLISPTALGDDLPGASAAQFLCQATGSADLAALKTRLAERYDQVNAVISAAVDGVAGEGGAGDSDPQD
ncbi:MAG: [protein-PII] uridylyltransferase family protein [Marinibacterium sp.]